MKIKQNTARFDKKITYAEAHKKILKILKTDLKIPVNINDCKNIVLGEDKLITFHIKSSNNYSYSENNYRECNIHFDVELVGFKFRRGIRNFDIVDDLYNVLKRKYTEVSDKAKELKMIADNNALLIKEKSSHIYNTFKHLTSKNPFINIDVNVNISDLKKIQMSNYDVEIHMQGHFKHTIKKLSQEQTQNLLDKFKNLNDTMNEYDKGDY
jgi:hypothetical protein